MASFSRGFAQTAARENLAARFYKTFYYWNRAQATCFEVQNTASNALRRLQTGRVLVADQLSDRIHSHTKKPDHLLRDNHGGTGRHLTTAAEKMSTASKPSGAFASHVSNANFQANLSTHLRHVMRRVPHAVVVITSARRSIEGQSAEASFRGMTISSFNTVTLEPVPVISFNIRVPSSTFEAMQETGFFLIHILAGTTAGAAIADAFARAGNNHGQAFKALATGPRKEEIRIFSGSGTGGAPLIAGDGVLQVLRCRLIQQKSIEVGDHLVIVAEVEAILTQPGVDASAQAADEALAYCSQAYRSLGGEPQPSSTPRPPLPGYETESVRPALSMNVRRGDESLL